MHIPTAPGRIARPSSAIRIRFTAARCTTTWSTPCWRRCTRSGFATLRFNFRGVGQSEGEFDNGKGEADDAIAAIRFLIAQKGVRAAGAVLAGYSFGAMTAVRAAASVEEVAAIVAVALPLGMIDSSALGAITKPIVLLAGDHDSYCPANHLTALAERLGPSARLKIIPGADHFFGGREHEITAALVEELATL